MSAHFTNARHNLGLIALDQAAAWARKRSYVWAGTRTPPETLEELKSAHGKSTRTGKPFPVSLEHSEDTIYMADHINVAWRFWHDQLHIEYNLGITLQEEIAVARHHLQVVEYLHGRESLEYMLMWADTEGQSRYCDQHGHFPKQQLRFAQCYVVGMTYNEV